MDADTPAAWATSRIVGMIPPFLERQSPDMDLVNRITNANLSTNIPNMQLVYKGIYSHLGILLQLHKIYQRLLLIFSAKYVNNVR